MLPAESHLSARGRFQGVAEELSRLPFEVPRPIEVIPNGVDRDTYIPNETTRADMRRDLGLSDEQLVAVFVGGDWQRKGLSFVVEAVGTVPEWHLVVVGKGDVPRYRRLAENVAPERVSLVGEQHHTAPYYAAADAFLLPTAYETFSISLHEAAASGLPLLATRVSGADDLIVEGQNGWFIDRDAAVIAERLRSLSSEPELMRRMGAAARASTEQLTWDRVVDAYADLYRRLHQYSERQ